MLLSTLSVTLLLVCILLCRMQENVIGMMKQRRVKKRVMPSYNFDPDGTTFSFTFKCLSFICKIV